MGHTPPSVPEPLRFDSQAGSFDRRAGLPAAAGKIAAALLELAPPVAGRALLEVGAGTGEIGAHLAAARSPSSILDYWGLDLSLPMLLEARRRSRRAVWLQADANRPWPVAKGSAGLIFLSRAAHLLAPDHLVDEALRAAHPAGARLAIGRVRRAGTSLRSRLRREMRRLLAGHGIEGRDGGDGQGRLIESFTERGATPLPTVAVATWPVVERPADSLASWREKPGLAGTTVPAAVKNAVLEHLEAWARERFGDLEAGREAEESYELAAVELTPATREERA